MANSFMEQMAFPKGWLGSFILKGMNIGHRKLWEGTLQGLSLPKEGRILDIGCGGGGMLHRLLREYPRLAADGLDVSETSVKESRRKNRCYGSRCTIAQGEATALPYEDGRFDLAVTTDSLYWWEDLARAFSEVHRVLKPGGRFVIGLEAIDPTDTTWSSKFERMIIHAPEEIVAYLEGAGFSDVRTDMFPKTRWVNGARFIARKAGRMEAASS